MNARKAKLRSLRRKYDKLWVRLIGPESKWMWIRDGAEMGPLARKVLVLRILGWLREEGGHGEESEGKERER